MALKSSGSASAVVATVPDGGARQKIGNNVFQTGQIQHLHIEFRDESQMALLLWRNGGRNARQGGHKQFVICPQLKCVTKMAKMPDRCMCSQQFVVKHRVTRLPVS
jgi:hypothetical protein